MKTLKCVVALIASAGLAFWGCSDKSLSPVAPTEQGSLEKVIITNFTFSHNPIPPYIIDPGDVKLVGGNWILKNLGVIEYVTSSAPLLTGTMIHYLSGNMDAISGEGPVHGSWTLTTG